MKPAWTLRESACFWMQLVSKKIISNKTYQKITTELRVRTFCFLVWAITAVAIYLKTNHKIERYEFFTIVNKNC